MEIDMTKAEEIIDNIARLNSQTWKDREEVRTEIGKLLSELKKSLEQHSEDCVSRTQAIEWIENLRQMDKCFGNYEDDYFPLSEVIDRLKNVPPVTPTQRWIPVSEELPEEETDVLICNANKEIAISRGSYSTEIENAFIWYTSGWRFGEVLSWQPLPKPYEEKRGNSDDSN